MLYFGLAMSSRGASKNMSRCVVLEVTKSKEAEPDATIVMGAEVTLLVVLSQCVNQFFWRRGLSS